MSRATKTPKTGAKGAKTDNLYLKFENGVMRGSLVFSAVQGLKGSFFGILHTGETILGTQNRSKSEIGSLKNGKLSSTNLLILENGGLIFGRFQEGRCHGSAVVKHGNGDLWLGRFRWGVMHGLYLKFSVREQGFRLERYDKGEVVEVVRRVGRPPTNRGEFLSLFWVFRGGWIFVC